MSKCHGCQIPRNIISISFDFIKAWWRHLMDTFSVLLALCVGNSPVTGEFPSQMPVTWSFLWSGLIKGLSKQWWFETPSRSLRRHSNGKCISKCLWNNHFHHGPVIPPLTNRGRRATEALHTTFTYHPWLAWSVQSLPLLLFMCGAAPMKITLLQATLAAPHAPIYRQFCKTHRHKTWNWNLLGDLWVILQGVSPIWYP